MRKSIKKIAATLLAATMVLGVCSSALAEDEAPAAEETATVYSVVGAGDLGITAWEPAATDCQMTQVSNSVYKFTSTATVTNADAQFKIVKDGPDMEWAEQMQYGTGVFADNCSQFSVSVTAGDELTFIANVLTGEIEVLNNGVKADVKVRWDSKAESPAEYTSLADAMTTYVTKDDIAYSVVGAGELGVNWDPANAEFYAVDKGGVFVKTLVATADSSADLHLQFKVVEDGITTEWASQMEYGTGKFGDNRAQFEVTAVKGDIFEVFFVPATGDVTVLKNGAVDADATVRVDTRGEAPQEFVSFAAAKAALHAEDDSVYSVVGTSDLAGLYWEAGNAQYLVNGKDGAYTKVVLCTKDSETLEFKMIQDGPDQSWANQLELGTGKFHDNASQFRVAGVAGDVFAITFVPETGDVTVTKNGEDYDYTVRWASKDEDPQEFLTKAEALAAFVNKGNDNGGNTPAPGTDNKVDTPAAQTPADKKTDAPAAQKPASTTSTTAAAKTGDALPIALMVTLFAAVAVVAVVSKKKEA